MNQAIAAVLALGFYAFVPGQAAAQDQETSMQPDAVATQPRLTAVLIDADKKAKKKTATVSVAVKGIKLIAPDSVKGMPHAGQGHLHYRLDGGPIIATTATKLSFHDLTPGSHTLTVLLAANDHTPLGPSATLAINIP